MNQTNKEGLISYLLMDGKKVNESWETLSKTFGFNNGESARNCWKAYRNNHLNKTQIDNHYEKALDIIEEFEQKINTEKGTASTTFLSSKEVLTVDEIYKECKMDPAKWVMTQIWHKKRATGFVYSADFKLKPGNHIDNVATIINEVLNKYKTLYIPTKKEDIIINQNFVDPIAVYISLTDAHLDRLTTNGRSLKDATQQYLEVVDHLIMKSYCCNLVDEVVYVIGNDLFDSDTYFSETTAGTQQHSNSMYYDAYEAIFDMQVKAICKLKQFCNKLHIKFVPGNHDRTKGFYLVHALEVYFKSDKNIVFDRGAENTKVYSYGNNFIGMHHGDTKPEALPLYFAKKYAKEWGSSKFQEIGIGDKHQKKSWDLKVKPSDEDMNGVRIFMTPSLCDNTLWEKNGLLDTGITAGVCRWYNKYEGKTGELEKRLFLKD